MQSAFLGADRAFLVTLLKRETATKKRLYYNFGCTISESKPHQTICASQKASQKRMGTGVAWGVWFENGWKPESPSVFKSQANPTQTLKSVEPVKSVGLPADAGVTCWFSRLSLLFGKPQSLPTPPRWIQLSQIRNLRCSPASRCLDDCERCHA